MKEGKLVAFLKKIGKPVGNILDLAGNITGIDAIEKIGEAILGSSDLSPEDKQEAMKFLALDVQDRASAREMQVSVATSANSGWFARNFIYMLSSFVIVSATVFGIMMFYVDFPSENKRLVEMFADIYLFAGALMILQFFFGSSEGSKTKDKILGK